MYRRYMSIALGDTRTRKDFGDFIEWNDYKRDTEEKYRKLQKGTFRDRTSTFYYLHDRLELKEWFRKKKVRRLILLERMVERLRLLGKLPERLYLSLEDFIVHWHWFKDTFIKEHPQIMKDLETVDNELYWDIYYSVLYKDVDVQYRYRVGLHTRAGKDCTINRVNNRVVSNLGEHQIKTYGKATYGHDEGDCIIRDRVRYFKDYFERLRVING